MTCGGGEKKRSRAADASDTNNCRSTTVEKDFCNTEACPDATPSGTKSVKATLKLAGITAAQFDNSKRVAFRKAIAATLKGVETSGVFIIEVKDVARRRLSSGRVLQSSAILVKFRVEVDASSSVKASEVAAELQSKTESGELTTALQTEGIAATATLEEAPVASGDPSRIQALLEEAFTATVGFLLLVILLPLCCCFMAIIMVWKVCFNKRRDKVSPT